MTLVLAKPGPVAVRAADDALANVGVREDGPPYRNRGKFVDIYLAGVGLTFDAHEEGAPWCAAFVEKRMMDAAHELGVSLPADFPRGIHAAAAAAWKTWALGRGLFFAPDSKIAPQKGDLCCFDIASEGGIHHIGIVVDHDAGTTSFASVEGNTYAEGQPSRDGYCVAVRHRTYGSLGELGGFIRLPW